MEAFSGFSGRIFEKVSGRLAGLRVGAVSPAGKAPPDSTMQYFLAPGPLKGEGQTRMGLCNGNVRRIKGFFGGGMGTNIGYIRLTQGTCC